MIARLEIGMMAPPVVLDLFVIAGITKTSIMRVVRAVLPWLSVLLVFLVSVTCIPLLRPCVP